VIGKKVAVPVLEEDFWQPILAAYETAPSLAFAMAQAFVMLQETLKDPDGVQEVTQSLESGIREIYQYTNFYQACVRLYAQAVSSEGIATHLDPIILVGELDKGEKTSGGAGGVYMDPLLPEA
jgi:hypothetical protein